MEAKLCRKCLQTKPLDEFYGHSQMGDGHLNKCKECTKADVREHRAANLEYYQNYDRQRYANDNGRKEHCHECASRAGGKYSRAWAERNRDKRKAQWTVSNAIRDGKITRPALCSRCGLPSARIEAHHADYSKPLDVEWLCKKCHSDTWTKPTRNFEPRKRGGFHGHMKPSRAA